MIDSLPVQHVPVNDTENGIGQIRRTRRRPYLVGHDIQFLFFGSKPQHRLHEVLPVRGIQPGRPENDMAAAGGGHSPLPLQFRPAVHAHRLWLTVFGVRDTALSIEYIVSGYMYQRGAAVPGGSRQISGSGPVEKVRRQDIILGPVHIGIGSAIDYHIRADARSHVLHGFGIRYVETDRLFPFHTVHIRKYESMGSCSHVPGNIPQLHPELPVRPCHKYFHIIRFSSVRFRPVSQGSPCPYGPVHL